jgi:hypothetical protein
MVPHDKNDWRAFLLLAFPFVSMTEKCKKSCTIICETMLKLTRKMIFKSFYMLWKDGNRVYYMFIILKIAAQSFSFLPEKKEQF